jgi:hypothetical protein
MKRPILLLAIPATFLAALAMGGSATETAAAVETAELCGSCCPEVACPEDCCPIDCCSLDKLAAGDCESCPGAALLSAAAEKLSEAGAAIASLLPGR